MGRIGAFLIHLGISLVIFAVLAYLVLFVWYPDFFFASDGGWQGMRIIVFVDLVLGPTLTLIVFNNAKPRTELRRDLSIIGFIQLLCLVAGTYVVWESRPIALVYVDGIFYSMSKSAYERLGTDVPDLSAYPGHWPKRLAVDLPEDFEAQSEIRRMALNTQTPLRLLTRRYKPLEFSDLKVARNTLTPDQLRERLHGPEVLAEWESQHGPLEQSAFFPIQTRYGVGVLGLSRERLSFTGLLYRPLDALERDD